MTMTKSARRRVRGAQTRRRQERLEAHRIVARLSGRHIYAQVVAPGGRVLAAVCTPQKTLREELKGKCSDTAAASQVGRLLAEKAAKLPLGRLAFDRGGRKYHGRIKAMAEAMRAGGMQF